MKEEKKNIKYKAIYVDFDLPMQHTTYSIVGNIGRGVNLAVWWISGNPPNSKTINIYSNPLQNIDTIVQTWQRK